MRKFSLGSIIASLALIACGGDSETPATQNLGVNPGPSNAQCNEGEVTIYEGFYYLCQGGTWLPTGPVENTGNAICNEGEITIGEGFYYLCQGGTWLPTGPVENTGNAICNEGETTIHEENAYLCQNGDWSLLGHVNPVTPQSSATVQPTVTPKSSASQPKSSASVTPKSSAAAATNPCDAGKLYVPASLFGEGTDLCYDVITVGGRTWMVDDLKVFANLEWDTRMNWQFAMKISEGAISTTTHSATEKVQGVCPSGWHVSNLSDWNALFAAPDFDSKVIVQMNMDIACGLPNTPNWWTSTKTGSSPTYCDPCAYDPEFGGEFACSSQTSDSHYEFHVRCVKN